MPLKMCSSFSRTAFVSEFPALRSLVRTVIRNTVGDKNMAEMVITGGLPPQDILESCLQVWPLAVPHLEVANN